MNRYLVRVELHHATYDDYVSLHTRMEGKGFSRTIAGDDGQVYHLPTAEYYYYGSSSCIDVLAAANAAAIATGRSAGVIVAEATQLRWMGLTKA